MLVKSLAFTYLLNSASYMTDFDYNTIPAGYYDVIFRENGGPRGKWHDLKFQHVQSRMADYRRHLDIGCGPGTFIGTLSKDKESIGVDISAAQIAYATENYATAKHRFETVTSEKLPYSDNSFDCITLVEVIEHLTYEYSVSLLKEAYRVLEPGGRLMVTTPNYSSSWPLLERVVNRYSTVSYVDQHIVLYKKPMVERLFAEVGFTNVSVSGFQGYAFLTAVMSWKMPERIQGIFNAMPAYFSELLILGVGVK